MATAIPLPTGENATLILSRRILLRRPGTYSHDPARHAPPVELVQSLFDLTPAEAQIARSLASGKIVEAIATDVGSL